jgi:hypothetical protein
LNSLYRKVVVKSEFDALMPFSSCEKIRKSKGDTHTSIELIIQQAIKHSEQVSKIAPLLKGNNLQHTCNNIHSFLFNHFQYKADDSEQLLRSPACAWQKRLEGIDCKSYSIIASCLLINLGLKHYIRKIKQPTFNPEGYTHVYAVVPKNQLTGDLRNGYYTIDGTLPTTVEPKFIETKDFYMDLQHYALNGAQGLNAVAIWDNFKSKFLSNLSLKSISNLKCWGGTGFTDVNAEQQLAAYNNYVSDKFLRLHQAIEQKQTPEQISVYINEIRRSVSGFWLNFETMKGEGWNQCSRQNMSSLQVVMEQVASDTMVKFEKWLQNYFSTVTQSTQFLIASEIVAVMGGFPSQNKYGIPYYEYNYVVYTIKDSVIEIAAFEFTPYMLQTPSSSFDIKKYIETASLFLNIKGITNTGSGTGSGTGGSSTSTNDTVENTDGKSNTVYWVVGGIGLSVLAWKLYTANQSATKKTTKTPTKVK